MPERTNEDIVRIVNKWQSGPFVHELTCGVDSRHDSLEPIERDGRIVLVCPTCAWVQERIPEAVLESEKALDFATALWIEAEKRQRRNCARQDVWWTSAMIAAGGTVLGGMFWGYPFMLVGFAVSGAIAAILARRKFRKIDETFGSRP